MKLTPAQEARLRAVPRLSGRHAPREKQHRIQLVDLDRKRGSHATATEVLQLNCSRQEGAELLYAVSLWPNWAGRPRTNPQAFDIDFDVPEPVQKPYVWHRPDGNDPGARGSSRRRTKTRGRHKLLRYAYEEMGYDFSTSDVKTGDESDTNLFGTAVKMLKQAQAEQRVPGMIVTRPDRLDERVVAAVGEIQVSGFGARVLVAYVRPTLSALRAAALRIREEKA